MRGDAVSASLHHRIDGDGPVLFLGPSLGTSLALWDAVLPALAKRYRVVRWDLPGHGGTAADVLPAGSGLDDLADLVLHLADELEIRRFGYAGVSLGGAVGVWLAARYPKRVTSLAVLCSAVRFGEPERWRQRADGVRRGGLAELTASAPTRLLSPATGAATAAALTADHQAIDPVGYAACCDVLETLDLGEDLAKVIAPTLVVAGRDDRAAPPDNARALADGIRDSTLVEIPRAGHLAPMEQPERVADLLRHHLAADAGMAVRRAVLGDEHVDRATAGTTELTRDFQDLITRYAWGEIWTRTGLDRRTRSAITITALVAGGHHTELAMHIRAALRNGLTRAEIAEVLLQSAVYCGVPAANTAFAVASRVLDEEP